MLTIGIEGTGAASLPGGHRTGAPGKHVVRGKAKYRLIDEQVRYFVAPSIEDIANSSVSGLFPGCSSTGAYTFFLKFKPYVHVSTRMLDRSAVFGKLPRGGLNGDHYLKIAQDASFTEDPPLQQH